MQCPYCSGDSQVVDSRAAADGIRRRRTCATCRRRFTTYERLAPPQVKVVKRSGKSEAFDADKIVRVLGRVSGGRAQVSNVDFVRIARALEASLLDEGVKSVSSADILGRLLNMVSDVDALVHSRLSADYIDGDGQLRISPEDENKEVPQLDFFSRNSKPKP